MILKVLYVVTVFALILNFKNRKKLGMSLKLLL